MQNVYYREPGLWHHWKTASNGAVTFDEWVQASKSFTIRESSGYVGPFPQQKPLPPHDYNFNMQQITLAHDASYSYTNGSSEFASGAGLYPTVSGATLTPPYDWSYLENRAIEKLNEETRGKLDLSVDIAEASKTYKMLKLQDQVLDYTKTFIRRFGPYRAASKAWLTYTYGVKPLVSSIFGVADENIRIVMNKTQRYRVRVTDKWRPTGCSVRAVVGTVNFPVTSGHVKVSVSYGLDLRTDQFDLARWTSLNPVSLAWELLPFSFVVDWFLDVGGYLRNLETYLLYANKFRSGYRTRFSASDLKFGLTDSGVGVGELGHLSRWVGTLKHINIDRDVLASYPAPYLPTFKAELGSSRLISGAALLAQLLGRR